MAVLDLLGFLLTAPACLLRRVLVLGLLKGFASFHFPYIGSLHTISFRARRFHLHFGRSVSSILALIVMLFWFLTSRFHAHFWPQRSPFTQNEPRVVQTHVTAPSPARGKRGRSSNLSDRDWVVYIEGPPSETSSPEHVLKYLARYLTGGPISDRRLIEESNGNVAFLVRAGDGSDKQIRVERSGTEIVRLWSLHILPKGFTKSRFFGGWSNNQRATFLDRCRKLRHLSVSIPPIEPAEMPKKSEEKEVKNLVCPKCEAAMDLESSQQRPSWRVLFTGPTHPE